MPEGSDIALGTLTPSICESPILLRLGRFIPPQALYILPKVSGFESPKSEASGMAPTPKLSSTITIALLMCVNSSYFKPCIISGAATPSTSIPSKTSGNCFRQLRKNSVPLFIIAPSLSKFIFSFGEAITKLVQKSRK